MVDECYCLYMWMGQNIRAGSVLQGKAAHLLAAREQAEQSESEVPGMIHPSGACPLPYTSSNEEPILSVCSHAQSLPPFPHFCSESI